jgi:hypothetical protein
VVACLALGASVALTAPAALADRAPTKSERAAIKRVAAKPCAGPPSNCKFKRARVSTRNARYAWASVIGEGVSGVLVKRRTKHARRFRTIGVQGGGIQACSYWRRRAPRPVLRDLHIRGVIDDTGATHSCG